MQNETTTAKQEFFALIVARAAADETVAEAALADFDLFSAVLKAELPRIMRESVRRQIELCEMFTGERWTHEGRDEFQRITVMQQLYEHTNQ